MNPLYLFTYTRTHVEGGPSNHSGSLRLRFCLCVCVCVCVCVRESVGVGVGVGVDIHLYLKSISLHGWCFHSVSTHIEIMSITHLGHYIMHIYIQMTQTEKPVFMSRGEFLGSG